MVDAKSKLRPDYEKTLNVSKLKHNVKRQIQSRLKTKQNPHRSSLTVLPMGFSLEQVHYAFSETEEGQWNILGVKAFAWTLQER